MSNEVNQNEQMPVQEEQTSQVIISNDSTKNSNHDDKPKNNKKLVIILVGVIVFLLIVMVGGYVYLQNNSKSNNDDKKSGTNNNDVVDKDETDDKEDETDTDEEDVVEPDGTYQVATWNNNVAYTPVVPFYNELSEETVYTNVATLKTGETVVRVVTWWNLDYFLVDANNNVTFLAKYSVAASTRLIPSIKIDNESTIPEICPEDDITYKGQTLEFTYHSLTNLDEAGIDESKGVKVQTTKYGDLYQYLYTVADELYVRVFYLKTPDKAATHYYELKNVDIYNDDRTINVKWDDDANKTINWQMPISGCGNGGSRLHIKGYTLSMGTKIGTTVYNKPLYRLTDEKILKLLYDEYYYSGVTGHELSFDEFKTKLTSIVYQDDLGEWIVLQNGLYSHAAECGKPVIYLYPEKDTYVNVEVGANVTLSDPLYVSGGWKNVLADTKGNLVYNGNKYDSLFWEGTGYGMYPNVSKKGRVVKQEQLVTTIISDLKAQGLNDKEIKDFMEFWEDALPKSPYVKLTWLTTKEMNTLAPLKVTPKPDTVIRVFMDAKGLEKPIKLTPQVLTKIDRKGFTLVEWGGLLNK